MLALLSIVFLLQAVNIQPVRAETVIVGDHTMCENVQSGDPVNRTNIFYIDDITAYSWLMISGPIHESHFVEWYWYDPDGGLLSYNNITSPTPNSSGYAFVKCWAPIPIAGDVSFFGTRLQRPFQTKVFIDGTLVFTETWQVVADLNVTLNFPPGTSIKSMRVTEFNTSVSPYPQFPGAIGPIYNITVITSGFTGNVTVGIHYDPSLVSNPSKLVIAQFDFLPGDVNQDGKVNLADLVALARAYGSKPGDTNWNPDADIDGNGIVGLSDLVTLAQHYGKTAEWIDRPTTVDTLNDFVYCITDHFSGIGIHYS